MQAGGEAYTMIPCLNTNPLWIDVLSGWVNDFAEGKKNKVLGDTNF